MKVSQLIKFLQAMPQDHIVTAVTGRQCEEYLFELDESDVGVALSNHTYEQLNEMYGADDNEEYEGVEYFDMDAKKRNFMDFTEGFPYITITAPDEASRADDAAGLGKGNQ